MITIEQFIAGALAKFGKIENSDLQILLKMAKKKKITCSEKIPFPNILKINNVSINENGIFLTTAGPTINDIERLKIIAGPKIIDFFDKLDLEEYILRKIENKECVTKDELYKQANTIEKDTIDKLLEKKLLTTSWNDDVPHEDFLEVSLSQQGKIKLYYEDYQMDIEFFKGELDSLCYDKKLLPDFLSTQDLTKPACQLLTVERFLNFCYEYDRCEINEDINSVEFKKLKSVNEDGSIKGNKPSSSETRSLLAICDKDHAIIICNPSQIFGSSLIKDTNNNILTIDWNDIEPNKLTEFERFTIPASTRGFSYIHTTLTQEMGKKLKARKKAITSHLAVIEEYKIDGETNYLARGIIQKDEEGYSMVLNPEYEKALPQTIKEKVERFAGNNTPYVYQIKRNTTSN